MIRLGGLWKGKSGRVFAKGTLGYDELVRAIDGAGLHGKKCSILIFTNDRKTGPNSPDYAIYLAEEKERERGENPRHVVGDEVI